MPFPDNTFDLCYSIAMLEHCVGPYNVMTEMKRVVKPGEFCYIQVGPLYYSPFGHHMFGCFDNYPWVHLRLSKYEIIPYCKSNGIEIQIERKIQMPLEAYMDVILNQNHINGKKLTEYGISDLMKAPDVEIISFTESYEGENLLSDEILYELQAYSSEDLTAHGFELVFRVKD